MIRLGLCVLKVILDLLPRPSTLRSLCLTCKQLRLIALPYLYHTVIVDLHKPKKIVLLDDSIKAGAGFFMTKHTQRLIFIGVDTLPTLRELDQEQFLYALGTFDDFDQYTKPVLGWEEMMYHVLICIPPNQLRAFSFFSVRSLPLRVWKHLVEQQRELEHIRLPFVLEHNRFQQLAQSAHWLKSLTVSVGRNEEVSYLLNILCNRKDGKSTRTTLEKLHIMIQKGRSPLKSATMSATTPPKSQLTIKRLIMEGVSANSIFPFLERCVDIRSLHYLVLWRCADSDRFLQNLAATIENYGLDVPLIGLSVFLLKSQDANLAVSLDKISKFANLISLHILFESIQIGPCVKLPPSLRSLSYHQEELQISGEPTMLDHTFEDSIKGCKYLQQLGIQVDENLLLPGAWYYESRLRKKAQFLWAILEHFPSLETLHIRPCQRPHGDQQTETEIENFTTCLFRFCEKNGFCPQLTMVVIGTSPMARRSAVDQIPPRWYSKGTRTDGWNGTATVAVPIVAHAVRDIELASDVVEFDPSRESDSGSLAPW